MTKSKDHRAPGTRESAGKIYVMIAIVIAMLVTLAIAAGTAGLVLVGMEGRGLRRAPKIAEKVARAAESLNGER